MEGPYAEKPETSNGLERVQMRGGKRANIGASGGNVKPERLYLIVERVLSALALAGCSAAFGTAEPVPAGDAGKDAAKETRGPFPTFEEDSGERGLESGEAPAARETGAALFDATTPSDATDGSSATRDAPPDVAETAQPSAASFDAEAESPSFDPANCHTANGPDPRPAWCPSPGTVAFFSCPPWSIWGHDCTPGPAPGDACCAP